MKTTGNSAQALIEFAVDIALALLVVMRVIDIGRAVFYYATLKVAQVRHSICDVNQIALPDQTWHCTGEF